MDPFDDLPWFVGYWHDLSLMLRSRGAPGFRPFLWILTGYLLLLVNPSLAAPFHNISWGADSNGPSWNKALHVDESRIGCSSPPSQCLKDVKTEEAIPGISQVSIAFILSQDTAASYAAKFADASLRDSKIVEISFDDFLSQYKHIGSETRDDLLRHVISATKAINHNLNFGITVYTEELASPDDQLATLPLDIRTSIDRVHLYVTYRADGTLYDHDVATAGHLFPNAKVIAGAYPVDRIDYVPCAPSGRLPCTSSEELSHYQATIGTQASLLRAGKIEAIEFYPGFFGKEESIGWSSPRACAKTRTPECIRNTKAMRAVTAKILIGNY